MSQDRSQQVSHFWLFWWKISPPELETQVREYYSLGILRSARRLSALLLAVSGAATIVYSALSANPEIKSLSDALVFFSMALAVIGLPFVGLAAFIYRGQRWAMVCAMLYWTLEKGFQVYEHPKYAVGILIWWTTYMHAFYTASRVEQERRKKLAPEYHPVMTKDAMDLPDHQGEEGPSCPVCGSPTVARAQQGTGKLYFGCTNFKGGCRFNGCRDVPSQPSKSSSETALPVVHPSEPSE